MQCPNCHSNLSENSNRCIQCGRPIQENVNQGNVPKKTINVPPSNQDAWDAPTYGQWNQGNQQGIQKDPTIPLSQDELKKKGAPPPNQPFNARPVNQNQNEFAEEKSNNIAGAEGIKRKTILPPNINSRTSFRLVQIPQERMRFDSDDQVSVILNRDNLDKNNPTITSQEQASVYYERGSWYIQDKSSQKTTFKQIAHPTEINNGDIILMGDMMFRFEVEELNKKI